MKTWHERLQEALQARGKKPAELARYAGEQPPADRENYASQETSARASRLGLWGEPSPIPPWDYRKLKKN